MALFKSKSERDAEKKYNQVQKEQQLNDAIEALNAKCKELTTAAAQASLNGDEASYNIAASAIIEIQERLRNVQQNKIHIDIINICDSCTTCISDVFDSLGTISKTSNRSLDLKKIERSKRNISKYMKKASVTKDAIDIALKTSNPANMKHRSADEFASIKPLIDAEKAKLLSRMPGSNFNLSQEIAIEKSQIT